MSFSLKQLKPQVIDVKIEGDGEPITIPIRPLTYTEWLNVGIGIDVPKPPVVRRTKDGKMSDVEDVNDSDYQRQFVEYHNQLNLRRLAIALDGGGAEELKGKSLDEQVDALRDIDTGIVNALVDLISRMARTRTATRFRD